MLSQQNKATEEPIEVTGKEFGEFDTSTKEGKKALRDTLRVYLETQLKGKFIRNNFLGRDIEIRQRGIDEMLFWSANPEKLKMIAQIEEIIRTAKGSGEYKQANYKQDSKPGVLSYFHLTNNVSVEGNLAKVGLIIEEDDKGLLHYDLTLDKNKITVLDSVETIPDTKSGVSTLSHTVRNDDINNKDKSQAILDDVKNSFDYINSLAKGVYFDSTELAEAQLGLALDMLKNNLAINEKEGNFDQANLERKHIQSIDEALEILQNQKSFLDDTEGGRYVLNLFVEYQDENGNWVELKDEEDEPEIDTTQIKDN
ncbi:hypothetical protein [Gallibacterium anatis]|uniref:Large polyvalent protein-associated domain-containing protein n=1 Tax=Gallibacterium anatis TaxID=750 RepID=A0A0A2XTH5_9PAST|nr:hypothetical protein [Gallibacterium anatis]KGQ34382.1 hypothetical protein JP32_00705 [Gallibacterium anatis]